LSPEHQVQRCFVTVSKPVYFVAVCYVVKGAFDREWSERKWNRN